MIGMRGRISDATTEIVTPFDEGRARAIVPQQVYRL